MNTPIRISFLLSVLVFWGVCCLQAQQLDAYENSIGAADSINLQILNLPVINPPVSFAKVTPAYRYFYIYGDGAFEMTKNFTDLKHSTNHRYPFHPAAVTHVPDSIIYHARAYGIGIYSNGEPPPDELQSPPFHTSSDTNLPGSVEVNRIVADSLYLNILPHAQAKKGESLVYVLAVHNARSTSINNAELQLFFESEIEELITSPKGKEQAKGTTQFSSFPIEQVLVHSNKVSSQAAFYNNQLPQPLSDHYKSALSFKINNLEAGKEEHIFVELMVDSLNFKAFDGKNKAQVEFLAVLNTQDQELLEETLLSPEEQQHLAKIGYQSALNTLVENTPDITYTYQRASDTTRVDTLLPTDIQGISGYGNVLAMKRANIQLVKEHDPNFLAAVSCLCPQNEGRNKLFITLHAENDGWGDVYDVFFDMALPDGLSASDIVGQPIAHHPYRPDLQSDTLISYEVLDDKNVRWHMRHQLIESIQEHGVGDPRTYAEVQFEAFTDLPPSTFDSLLQVCVRFNSLANDELCTYPVPVTLVEDAAQLGLDDILSCAECEKDPAAQAFSCFGMPWWLCLVVLLAIILAVAVVYFANKGLL